MEKSAHRIFVTDCEGPITKNDNAAELAAEFIPSGDEFFRRISLYDDYLAEVVRKPGYKAGDTLKLILPFYKAFGLDQEAMREFSFREIQIVPQADFVLRELHEIAPAYIVSTSYSCYISAVCEAMGFPFSRTYCTEVDLDSHRLRESERSLLKEIHARILDAPSFEVPTDAKGPEDLKDEDRVTLGTLDKIFWDEMPKMDVYELMRRVNPIGGVEKANAVRDIVAKERVDLSDVIYVGDSITDVEAFRLVREFGGVAVSFNGNDWAVREATYAVTAHNALPTGWLVKMFLSLGPDSFKDMMMAKVSDDNVARISASSCRVRKEVRSESIGRLG